MPVATHIETTATSQVWSVETTPAAEPGETVATVVSALPVSIGDVHPNDPGLWAASMTAHSDIMPGTLLQTWIVDISYSSQQP